MSCWSIPLQGFDDESVAAGVAEAGPAVDLGSVKENHACQVIVDEGAAGATQVFLDGSMDGTNFYRFDPSTPYYTGDGATGIHVGLISVTGAARYVRAVANQLSEWGGCTGLTTWHSAS